MPSKDNFQKELRNNIFDKLDGALTDLKAMLGDKEFADRAKKAAKLFAEGVKEKSSSNEEEKPKKAAKKNTSRLPEEENLTNDPATVAPKKAKKSPVKSKGKKK